MGKKTNDLKRKGIKERKASDPARRWDSSPRLQVRFPLPNSLPCQGDTISCLFFSFLFLSPSSSSPSPSSSLPPPPPLPLLYLSSPAVYSDFAGPVAPPLPPPPPFLISFSSSLSLSPLLSFYHHHRHLCLSYYYYYYPHNLFHPLIFLSFLFNPNRSFILLLLPSLPFPCDALESSHRDLLPSCRAHCFC